MDDNTPDFLEPTPTVAHYDTLADHPSIQYPPPSYIDFASGNLRPPLSPTRPSPLSLHCEWLGGPHDGYALANTLDQYMQLRQTGSAPGTLEYAALIQAQLTFGLLEAFLQIKIPETFLVSQAADETTTLSTTNLPVLVRDWYHRARLDHHLDKCQSWLNDVETTMYETSRRLMVYSNDQSIDPFLAARLSPQAAKDINRVACMIGVSLDLALSGLPQECRLKSAVHAPRFHSIPDQQPARRRALEQQWCPFTIAALSEPHRFVVLEYAASLPPFLRHPGEHAECTETDCTGSTFNGSTYVPRHSSDECCCPWTIPAIDPVVSLLSDGRIPTLTLSDGRLYVLTAEEKPYVAVSHVWIDGMGGFTDYGLPSCQVARIASMTSSLVPEGAFWMDSLCVPEDQPLRRTAIQLMAKTYSNAAAVLVIDAAIRSCSKDAPLEEKLLRIVTSIWMQRLWPFQEALLARRLYFEFRDGLVAFESLMPCEDATHYVYPLVAALAATLYSLRRPEHGPLTLGQVHKGVSWRRAKLAEDETVLIAGLLDIDFRELLKASSPDERMRSLLLQKGKVDPNIIFGTGRKLHFPGFLWAPQSLLSEPQSLLSGPQMTQWAEESAICTDQGLWAEYPALVFREPVQLYEQANYVVHDNTRPDPSYYLLQMVESLPRARKQELCDALLIRGECQSDAAVRSSRMSVGVLTRMAEIEDGTSGKLEPLLCRYQDIVFNVWLIDVSEASRIQHSGIQVIYAKSCVTMKVVVW